MIYEEQDGAIRNDILANQQGAVLSVRRKFRFTAQNKHVEGERQQSVLSQCPGSGREARRVKHAEGR